MKIDLHVHSRYSSTPEGWVLRKLGAQASYTDPIDVYKIAKNRGMDAVTITDNDSIEGCLEIAHLSDTFISCEYTTFFPLDSCRLHVVCYNITPDDHERILQLRSNIFELTAYLKRHGIHHALAHPLYSPNDKLTPEHFDQLLPLFDTWEINGAKDASVNDCLKKILDFRNPGYTLTAGSNDHSSLTIGNTWTEVPGARNVKEFFEGVAAGKAFIFNNYYTPHEHAWNIFSVGWQWLKKTEFADGLVGTMNSYLLPPERNSRPDLARRLRVGVRAADPRNWPRLAAMLLVKRQIQKLSGNSIPELPVSRQWYNLVDALTDKYLAKVGSALVEGVIDKKFHRVLSFLGAPAALYSLVMPFLISFADLSGQRRGSREILRHYMHSDAPEMKVVKFTDTFGSVDGVSWTLAEQLKEAHKSGKNYTIVSCVGDPNVRGLKRFEPVGMITAPEYKEQKLCWPPLLKMLEFCYENQFTVVQAATPGPVGLAGMLIARVLGRPFQAVYHTQVPEFIGKATGERFMEVVARKYCMLFYDSADTVFAPSGHTRAQLIRHGVRQNKVKVYPRGINTVFFHPSKRSDYWHEKWGVSRQAIKGLFVGRVSHEKDVPLLVRAFKALIDERETTGDPDDPPKFALLAVGDGAYRDQMKRECQGYPVVLTGQLHGEELATAFASADFFVFPSTTDTFGRVLLEAMASGLPCIVSDKGGPQESIQHGLNGLIFRSPDGQSLKDAMVELALSPNRRQMGAKARAAAEQRSFAQAFEEFWKLYS